MCQEISPSVLATIAWQNPTDQYYMSMRVSAIWPDLTTQKVNRSARKNLVFFHSLKEAGPTRE